VSRRAGINRAPTASGVVLRDAWRHVDLAHLVDEVGGVIGLVGPLYSAKTPNSQEPPIPVLCENPSDRGSVGEN
jgi:hypothetical protein